MSNPKMKRAEPVEDVEEDDLMQDDIDDIEEIDPDEEAAVGEEMSSVMGYMPPDSWRQRPSVRRIGLSRTYGKNVALPRWRTTPDVLGYLNSFRDISDGDRLRLARACANYLNHQERQRNGYFERRRSTTGTRKRPLDLDEEPAQARD